MTPVLYHAPTTGEGDITGTVLDCGTVKPVSGVRTTPISAAAHPLQWLGYLMTRSRSMASEAKIAINGTVLSDEESMTVRLAVDALANILSEKAESKEDPVSTKARYMAAIGHVQALLAGGSSDATVN